MHEFYSVQSLFRLDDADRVEYLRGLLLEGQVALFVGREKSGKSYFLNQLLISLAVGNDWGQGRIAIPQAQPVLYVQTEGSRFDAAERVVPAARLLHPDKELPLLEKNFYLTSWVGLDLRTGDEVDVLKEEIARTRAKVLAVDSLYASFSGSFNEDVVMKAVFQTIQDIRAEFPDLSMVLIHHEHRPRRDQTGEIMQEGSQAMAGSWVIRAMVDVFWRLEVVGNQYRGRRIFSVDMARSRFQGVDSFDLGMDYKTGLIIPSPIDPRDRMGSLLLWMKSLKWVSRDAVVLWTEENSIPKSTRTRWIRELLSEERIREHKVKGEHGYAWVSS